MFIYWRVPKPWWNQWFNHLWRGTFTNLELWTGVEAGPNMCIYIYMSGQIIATSHGFLTPKGSFLEGKSLISKKSKVVKYCNLARYLYIYIYMVGICFGSSFRPWFDFVKNPICCLAIESVLTFAAVAIRQQWNRLKQVVWYCRWKKSG